MPLEIRILGPIEVDLGGGRPAEIPRGRALSLLTLLVLNRGAVLHADRAIDALWGDDAPRNTRNALQVVVSRLRTAVGDGQVVLEGGGYALRIPADAVDADRFERLVRRGRDELARAEPEEALATLVSALGLWRGPALADVRDELFARADAARLDDLRLICECERIDAALGLGRHDDVAGELDVLVHEHPYHEKLHAQRMLALYRSGRQADALAAYRAARAALVDGLGIEPSPDLRALEAAILRQDVPAVAKRARGDQRPGAMQDRRRVTCLFARPAPPATPPHDPELLRARIERFHARAHAACSRQGGTIAELRGDAVLAVFGIPFAHEDDAQRAVRSAELLGAPAGIATGDVVAPGGALGATTVIGEPVAIAEQLGRRAGAGEIRLAESTWRLVRHAASSVPLVDGEFLLQRLDADAPAIPRSFDRPLVGRDDEIAVLAAAFERTLAGSSAELLAVIGEPGIGKTRLVAELAAISGGRAAVLTGRCAADSDDTAYRPLREVLVQATGGAAFADFARQLGVAPLTAQHVAVAVGLAEGSVADDPGWAVAEVLGALSRARPLVLVLDDMQEAQPALLELFLDLPAHLTGSAALIVAVARSELLHGRPAWAQRAQQASLIALGPLSDEASAALLGEIAGGSLNEADGTRILKAAGGNPLFLEQLAAYVVERPVADELPPAIHAVLAARLDRLDAAERSVLALGAVAGDGFDAASVHALAEGVPLAAVERSCDRLVGRDLLVREEGSAGAPRFRLRHALVREAAYASLAKSARARLHERHASWLEAVAELADADARIGFQLETAWRYALEIEGRPRPELAERAGRRLVAAARIAHARGDVHGEAAFLERALALLGDANPDGVGLLPDLFAALFEEGSLDRAGELAEVAVSASTELGLPLVQARADVVRERIRLSHQPETFAVETAIGVVRRASETLRAAGDDLGLAQAAYLMCDLQWLDGGPEAAYAHAEQMLEHADRAGSAFDIGTAVTFMAWSLAEGPVPADDAIERCDALAVRAAGDRAAEFSVIGSRAVLVAMTGDAATARADMARARTGMAALGLDTRTAYLTLLDAMLETIAGDPVAAELAVLDAAEMVRGTGDRWFLSMVHTDLAGALLAQGRDADAAVAVAAIEDVPAAFDPEWVATRHTVRAVLAARAGDPHHGRQEAAAAIEAAAKPGLIMYAADAWRALAEVERSAGEEAECASAAATAAGLDEAKGNDMRAKATRLAFGLATSGSGPATALLLYCA